MHNVIISNSDDYHDDNDDDNADVTWLWSLVFCAMRAISGVSATTVAFVLG